MTRQRPPSDASAPLPVELSELDGDPGAEAMLNRVYRSILADPAPTRERLREAGFPASSLDAALRTLVRHRLVDIAVDGRISPAPPDTALEAFAARIERHAESLLATAPDLAQLYRDARELPQSLRSERVRLLYSPDEVGRAVGEMSGRGRERLIAMRGPTRRILEVATGSAEVVARPISNARGTALRARVMYDSRLLAVPDAIGRMHLRADAEHQRVFPNLPFTATVVDDDQAVIDLTVPGRLGAVGLFLTSEPLVWPVLAMLERLWELSTPLPQAMESTGLNPRDTQVLLLLAAGASDAMIARQLGVSQRTVERRVRSILDALRAESRFQAGVLAKQAGWV